MLWWCDNFGKLAQNSGSDAGREMWACRYVHIWKSFKYVKIESTKSQVRI